MFELRPYQIQGAQKGCDILMQYKIVCFIWEVRTGKTLTSLYCAELYKAKHVLFITRKKAITSILDDAKLLGATFNLTVINYEQLHKFNEQGFDLIIADECHTLSAFPSPSQRTKLLKNIARGLPIIFLSGTITPESFSQIYHILWVSTFSPFAEWPSFYKWAAIFVHKQIKYLYNRQINDYSKADKAAIDKFCAHLFISYTQSEAGFSQSIDEEVLTVTMKPSTYKLAERLRIDKVYIGKDGQELLADTAVKLMNKMHQIFSGTVIFENGDSAVFDHTKAEFIRDRFAGKKIAVFYKFKAERDMLTWTFRGQVTDSPEAFRDADNLTFISQIQSGREGINLSTADALIFLNIDFSAVSYLQARARMQSKDRVKENKIYWVFSEGGIEGKIYEKVRNKESYTTSYFMKDYKIRKHELETGEKL